MYKQKLIDLLKSNEQTKQAMYDSFYQCDYSLQERFIRMFCEKNNIRCSFKSMYYESDTSYTIIYLWWNEIVKIDNTKDFDNQNEEVYQKIYEALISL